ncbi:hypothetical protein GEMRC1_000086 [Eukaryota sp. GEM-RC1]
MEWRKKVQDISGIIRTFQNLELTVIEKDLVISCTIASYNGDFVARYVSTATGGGHNGMVSEYYFEAENKKEVMQRAFKNCDAFEHFWTKTKRELENLDNLGTTQCNGHNLQRCYGCST